MAAHSKEHEWFRHWFNDIYKTVYSHRNQSKADHQVAMLLKQPEIPKSGRLLDIACGSGRHLRAFSKSNWNYVGCDLSAELLKDAIGLPVVRCDMRRLPFIPNQFDLVTSFFSSFGYFPSPEEDRHMLASLIPILKNKAFIFLDLPNRKYVFDHLVPYDEQQMNDFLIRQRRHLNGDIVVKDIIILKGGHVSRYQERLRLYTESQIISLLTGLGLKIIRIFGDEEGRRFDKRHSPRMSFLVQNY